MTLFCIQSLTLFQMNSKGSHIAPSQTSHLCQYHIAALETSDQSLGGVIPRGMEWDTYTALTECWSTAGCGPNLFCWGEAEESAVPSPLLSSIFSYWWEQWWETQRENSLWYGRTTATLQSKCTGRTNRNSYPVNLFRMIFTLSTSSPMVAKALETKFSSI